ncbi:MAG: hypothetical protein U5P10_14025 [Spirochaetia bacterium]|nr:hypothetical protein [Spirochaetia bacterium]
MSKLKKAGKNVGFISFRISGTDGVSLETKKWAEVFERHNYNCYYMAGELDTPPEVSLIVDEAHFKHPEIVKLYNMSFDLQDRPRELTDGLHRYREILKKKIYDFIEHFDIDLLIPQNTLTIPLNLPLGLALTRSNCRNRHAGYCPSPRFLLGKETLSYKLCVGLLQCRLPSTPQVGSACGD